MINGRDLATITRVQVDSEDNRFVLADAAITHNCFTSYAVAHLLHNVSHQHHRTIVATIHQPSSEIFHLFDDLVLINFGKIIDQ